MSILMVSTSRNSGRIDEDLTHASESQRNRPDWAFRVLVTALIGVAIWLLAMPWVPSIAHCTLRRFHLRTDSFAAWAIQQPIPPMYSFANTTQVRELSPDVTTDDSLPIGVLSGRTINHFPTREFTFANGRVRYLRERTSRWFVLQSAYRGQVVKSVYRLDPNAGGGWNVILDENKSDTESES